MIHKKPNVARQSAYDILYRVETEGAFADILIAQTLARQKMIHEDNALLSELVRGVLRWKKRLEWIVDQLWQGKREDLDASLRMILLMGLYQIIYLDRIPDFAAVDESVNLARIIGNDKWASVANGMLRSYLRGPEKINFPDPKKEPIKNLAVQSSHPRWLVELWVKQFGFENAVLLCAANNQPAPLSLRVNPLRISSEKFIAELIDKGISFSMSVVPGYVRTSELPYELQKVYLDKGWITVQDESAGLPNFLFQAQPGQTVMDLCAAPGGKTSHTAERCADRTMIIAADLQAGRTRLIRSTVSRLGLRSVQVVQADALHAPLRSADVVLLDAPCSGLGVLRRKPDLRWRRKPADIGTLARLQHHLLHAAGQLVAAKGVLIYSTCTIHPLENREMIASFLGEHSDFRLQHAGETHVPGACVSMDGFVETWPHRHNMDGSFAAKLIKE